MGNFFDELKRRNVVRIGVAYVVIGWLTLQLGEIVLPTFGAPEWVFKTVIFLVLLGFPFALLFAWAFELTTEGVKKTRDVNTSTSITATTGRKLDFVIIAALVFALGYFVWERQADKEPAENLAAEVDAPAIAEVDIPTVENNSRSIAVLPFVNMSSDESQEWFADGLTEEILNSLARTPDLLVTARTSSFAFKGSNQDITEIAKTLGVDHILEGSVRRSQSRLRVTAQLIRAADGFHLWSETFDRSSDDVIEIQENVAIEIANALETAMDPEALAKMVSAGTRSIPAYEAYLQGLAFGVESGRTGDTYIYLGARDSFELAVTIDPEFAKAHWQLALMWSEVMNTANISYGVLEIPDDELRLLFDASIGYAILHERDEASRLKYQALQAFTSTKLSNALRLISEFLKRRPNDFDGQVMQLGLLSTLSMYEELEVAIEDYAERSSHDPYVAGQIILTSLQIGRSDFIRRHANKIMENLSDDLYVRYQAHRALLWAGDIDGASRLLPTLLTSDFNEDVRSLASIRQACAEKRTDDADTQLARLAEIRDDRFMVWIVHKLKGEEKQAHDLLVELDEAREFDTMSDYLTYAYFDPSGYPNMMAMLDAEGAGTRQVADIPYLCK